ncbi:MAG: hypothetical protein ACE37D_15010 [Pseudomonadales bacterium]
MKRSFWLTFLILATATPASAEDIGRLFTSAEERRSLDSIKRNQELALPDTAILPEAIQAPVVTNAPDEVRFSGYIRRHDGTYAIWVNGQSALSQADSAIEVAKFKSANEATLTTSGQQATMRPGQIWSLQSNTIREGYYIERVILPELPGQE